MRIIYVGGTQSGGSGFSHREYVAGLVARGHEVETVVMRRHERNARNRLVRELRARTRGRLLRAVYRRVGRRPRRAMYDGHAYWRSWVPENTLGWLARRRPDIVVARLMSPRALREVGEVCRELDVPWGLHVAEDLAIECLRQSGTAPSVVIATARFHVDRLDALGYVSAYVPRILDLAPTRVESTREVVLQINPSPELGGELFWQIAQELPDYRFVLLESWRLPAVEAEALERRAASAANVEFRRFEPERSKIYRDARVLLAPHQVDNNPRVAVEAQANGIPVVGSDLAGLREVIGGGGTLVAVDAPASVWANAIRDLVDDQQLYERVVGAALAHAEMADCQPLHAVNVLESVLLRTAQGGCQPAVTGPSPEC